MTKFKKLKPRKTVPDDLKNRVIRSVSRVGLISLCYFNKKGVYVEYLPEGGLEEVKEEFISVYLGYQYEEWYLKDKKNKTKLIMPFNPIDYLGNVALPKEIVGVPVSRTALKEVILTLHPNDTYADLVKRYNELIEVKSLFLKGKNVLDVPVEFNHEYPQYEVLPYNGSRNKILINEGKSEISKFIYKIGKPIYERYPGNNNKKTFDIIRIDMAIPSKERYPNRKDFIKNNTSEIVKTVLDMIGSRKDFMKFGVPTNHLKLTKATILRTDELELIFELKYINLDKMDLLKTSLFK